MSTIKTIIETTPELIALGHDYPAISAWLNERPVVDNPESQEEVEVVVPLTISTLRELMTREEKAGLLNLPAMAVYLSESYGDANATESAVDAVADAFDDSVTGSMPFLAAVRTLVESSQTGALAALVTVMVQRGHLSSETAEAISAEMGKTTTTPDPNWSAKITEPPRYEQLGIGGKITPEMVQEAMN